MSNVKFRTQFSEFKEKPGIKFTKPSLTKQANKDECDINKIMAKYNLTSQLDHVRSMQPIYADATQFSDYRECLAKVRQADEAFMALPSDLRVELANNPANMVKYISDPANYEKCVKYGIFEKKAIEKPNVVNQPSADEVSAQ